MRKILLLLCALLAAIGFVAVPVVSLPGASAPASVASAGGCDFFGTYCGYIRNADGTGDYLIIGHNYSDSTHAASPNVQMGSSRNSWQYAAETSTNEGSPGWEDTDAFYIRICWRGHLWKYNGEDGVIYDYGYVYHTDGVGNGWHKVTNLLVTGYWKVDGLVYICG